MQLLSWSNEELRSFDCVGISIGNPASVHRSRRFICYCLLSLFCSRDAVLTYTGNVSLYDSL